MFELSNFQKMNFLFFLRKNVTINFEQCNFFKSGETYFLF